MPRLRAARRIARPLRPLARDFVPRLNGASVVSSLIPSCIYFPITILPTWLQSVAEAFPIYWVGLGARSAMLPREMVAVEIGQSWRTLEMFAVLGVWAVIGFVLAPILLRRMARRQSGSAIAKVRERYMTKGY
jgi:ABC-2 type transport system permease protein